MRFFTLKFIDSKGAVFQIITENNTEETLLDACVTADPVDGEPNLMRDGMKKFRLTLPVFNGAAL